MALFKKKATLGERLGALEDAAAIGSPYLAPSERERLESVARAGAERRELSAEHTVVGFFGATGSGKTSLFNAVVGEDLGKAAARRPTTSSPLAAIWQPEGSEELLDWLGVEDRRVRSGEFAPGAGPLILLDLPDFDSVDLSNREIATRLAGQVDVLVWVSDPEKYAEASSMISSFARTLRTLKSRSLCSTNRTCCTAPTLARCHSRMRNCFATMG